MSFDSRSYIQQFVMWEELKGLQELSYNEIFKGSTPNFNSESGEVKALYSDFFS